MYGGWSLLQARAWRDIYILSIPSFQWILVNATGQNDENSKALGHAGMSCHLYRGRQMVTLGGSWNNGRDVANDLSCSSTYPSIRVLDTTDITWADQWTNTSRPYEVPQAVYQTIGGKFVSPYIPACESLLTLSSAKGGATMRQPSGGFNDSLAAVFSQTIPISSSTATGVPPSSSPTSNASSTRPIGAIVGGVIGGLAAIAAAIGAIFWLRAWRRRKAPEPVSWEKPELSGSTGVHQLEDQPGMYGHKGLGDPLQADLLQDRTSHEQRPTVVYELGAEHRPSQLP